MCVCIYIHRNTFDRDLWTGDRPIAMPVQTQGNISTETREYKHKLTPQTKFEPAIPVYGRSGEVNLSGAESGDSIDGTGKNLNVLMYSMPQEESQYSGRSQYRSF
jgi:hypothetical protein